MVDVVNVGTSSNAGDGDPFRTAMQKVNAKFAEIGDGGGGTATVDITTSGSNTLIDPADYPSDTIFRFTSGGTASVENVYVKLRSSTALNPLFYYWHLVTQTDNADRIRITPVEDLEDIPGSITDMVALGDNGADIADVTYSELGDDGAGSRQAWYSVGSTWSVVSERVGRRPNEGSSSANVTFYRPPNDDVMALAPGAFAVQVVSADGTPNKNSCRWLPLETSDQNDGVTIWYDADNDVLKCSSQP